jgi:hypothetical protein
MVKSNLIGDLTFADMRQNDFLFESRNGSELWRTISQRFYTFLEKLRSPPIPLLEAPWENAGFTDHLLVLRVLDGGTDFEYRAAGAAVVDATGKNLVYERLSDTTLANFHRYGAAGNQGDMFALCSQAYRRDRPIELHNSFWNARQELCTIHVALVSASSAFLEADMVVGPAVIEPIVQS